MSEALHSNSLAPASLKKSANACGLLAIMMWAALALLTTQTQGIPPFQLLFLSFCIPFGLACLAALGGWRGGFRAWRQPVGVWCSGFAAIFLYHAFYFFALKAAPPAQASMIAYLWPLLIVLFSALQGGGRLNRLCLLGACLGLAGTALILQPQSSVLTTRILLGYAAALCCALVWSSYSVFNKRHEGAPVGVIGGICGLVALAGFICHLLLEDTVIPDARGCLAIVLLGLGPVGLAFFAWDYATKSGNAEFLGAVSYLAPLISTVLLVLAGVLILDLRLMAAAGLIVAGTLVATFGAR
ncbi:DMT family transporter [Pseudomonas xantholysinigenes]|uniref:DMT family transporter n=1 Tax=Pseudomonas xantholysinigenes TaxID=2745490 RepID=A0A9E6TYS4_9PSED|nr:DMT family transporter [Pseudomonas xantholysinigenes]QXI39711.1 DMT family transporter [Pseudomonas xantholysinigenes]